MSSTEDKENEIIRRTYANPAYSHADNILHRLNILKGQMSHEDAIDQLYSEVMDE